MENSSTNGGLSIALGKSWEHVLLMDQLLVALGSQKKCHGEIVTWLMVADSNTPSTLKKSSHKTHGTAFHSESSM
jgi:hypothetical protein